MNLEELKMEIAQETKDWRTSFTSVILGVVLFFTIISTIGIIYVSYKVSEITETIDSISKEQMTLVNSTQKLNDDLEALQSNVQGNFSALDTLSGDLDALEDDLALIQSDLFLIQNDLATNQDLLKNFYLYTSAGSQPEYSGLLFEEIKYRFGIYIQILDESVESMPNEKAVRLLDGLRGWHIDGQRAYEGESMISLIEQQIAQDETFEFLRETIDDLSQLRAILESREGERTAGVHQVLDYTAMAEINLRLKDALQELQNVSN
jgi:hypothetical protein